MSSEDKYLKFAEVFNTFSEIEGMIEYILDKNTISYNPLNFTDKTNKFMLYLDRRSNKTVNTDDKIFDDNKYSLEEVLKIIKKLRNIIAHEAGFLLSGLSALPKEARRPKLKRKYDGSLSEFHEEFMYYANLILPLYEAVDGIGGNTFEIIDINEVQIG